MIINELQEYLNKCDETAKGLPLYHLLENVLLTLRDNEERIAALKEKNIQLMRELDYYEIMQNEDHS